MLYDLESFTLTVNVHSKRSYSKQNDDCNFATNVTSAKHVSKLYIDLRTEIVFHNSTGVGTCLIELASWRN
jgi:hypothetical protein